MIKQQTLQENRARREKLFELEKDPFIGYDTYDEALEDYRLNPQAEVLARLLRRENVFISGPAGAGKTTLLNRFMDIIDGQFLGNINIALTASTGVASTLIGGQTIHSWSGLGINTEPFDRKNVPNSVKFKVKAMRKTDVLIIDEISMLPAYLFEKLDEILKWARRNDDPFGGVQLVLTGDFLQLPPVSKPGDNVNTGFAIQTQTWKEANVVCCYMDKTHRATDQKLKYLLSAIASGKAQDNPKVKQIIDSRKGSRQDCDPDKTYTTLFTTNKNVDSFNESELNQNPNPPVFSKAYTTGSAENVKKLYKKYGVPELFTFKIGATVMVTSNHIDPFTSKVTIANGSIGTVHSLDRDTGFPFVKFNDGSIKLIRKKTYSLTEKRRNEDKTTGDVWHEDVKVAEISQLPLKLGYAISVHKSQGQSLDGVVCDLKNIFTDGLGYVALSRVRNIDDLIIVGWSDRALKVDELSRKISVYVKREALKNREKFIEDKEDYLPLLNSSLSREIFWEKDEQDSS